MLYIILLTYRQPLDVVERHLEDHRTFLARHYRAGHFLLSGPQRPRVGGLILAAAMPRAELDTILAGDAFAQAGLADYQVVEFAATMTSPGLAALAENP